MRRKHAIWNKGPFTFYRCKSAESLDIFFTRCDNQPWGWEWGWRDDMRGSERPWVNITIGKLKVLYLETWKKGFEFWLLGFWWIV